MKFVKGLLIVLIALGALFVLATPVILKMRQNSSSTQEVTQLPEPDMLWGATVRPYALGAKNANESIEQQFQMVTELFPTNSAVRANIEKDMDVNDQLVAMKKKYNTRLYLVLEEDLDFNATDDYATKAQALAEKIVGRYKGQVEYYQLMNEVTGVIFSKADDTGETMDAGYGLTVNKTRYDNVLTYTRALSQAVRELDPNARIVLTGNWVLVDPVIDLVQAGVDTDIIGWNWGSGLSDEPGIIDIDNYGTLNIPAKVAALNKKFWLVEANRDDGSYGGKEQAQADYTTTLATAARDAADVQGYFHFTLTDLNEKGAAGALGLVTLQNGGTAFGNKKPAFAALQQVAAGQ